MIQTTHKLNLLPSLTEQDHYPYLLGISSDTLVVISEDRQEVIEWIVQGKDTDGTLLSAPDEDCFLEALVVIKDVILSGKNPLDVIEFN